MFPKVIYPLLLCLNINHSLQFLSVFWALFLQIYHTIFLINNFEVAGGFSIYHTFLGIQQLPNSSMWTDNIKKVLGKEQKAFFFRNGAVPWVYYCNSVSFIFGILSRTPLLNRALKVFIDVYPAGGIMVQK